MAEIVAFLLVVVVLCGFFAALKSERPSPPVIPQGDVLQVQIRKGEELRIAQRVFEPGVGAGSKLAWISEMIAKSGLESPVDTEILRPGEKGYIFQPADQATFDSRPIHGNEGFFGA
jgi:hypothetical protein